MCVFDAFLWPDDRATLATQGEDKIRFIADHHSIRQLLEKNKFDFDVFVVACLAIRRLRVRFPSGTQKFFSEKTA